MSQSDLMIPESASGISFVGHSDVNGLGDTCQVMIANGHAYVGHVFSGGVSVIDVRNPRDPRTVNFLPTPPNTWSIHLQTHGDLMLVINEFDFYSQYQEESDYYGRSINETGGRNFAAGIRVFDISTPARPREIGFMPVDGKGVHRIWWDGGRYAYASIMPWGFTDHIFGVIDLINPERPVEVGRWWVPGMWTAGGETPTWTNRWALHHPVVANNIAYCGWRDGGLILLDVSDPTKPTLVSHLNWSPPFGGGTHSGLPLPDRGLCIVPDEAIADNIEDGLKHTWVVDVSVPTNPVTISTLPTPADRDFVAKGGHFGPHNVHENRIGSFQSSNLIFSTYQNAGVRVFDISNQFQPAEVAHFVPPAPTQWNDYRPNRPRVVHSVDVYVAQDGLMYVTEGAGGGLTILQYDGI
ncbi:LVIVD repeat-containing protein [Subtercola lobariae]|uniref:Uncharacterized protein n=1 Tax=Subtercola lobariae TaxID=1588641 RepID=A0A917EV33_9MICO|nr:hypothetical protein [Subtercola lobariae]GGF10473.1 hypothetical protein GCM10011399_00420 [Subtercola lobariae]